MIEPKLWVQVVTEAVSVPNSPQATLDGKPWTKAQNDKLKKLVAEGICYAGDAHP